MLTYPTYCPQSLVCLPQVTSYSLSLHEIDTVVNSKGIPEPSAMEIMVRYEGSRRRGDKKREKVACFKGKA